METRAGFLKALGPGLLFAAAAVGVSHVVQSTRAGAQFGLALVGAVFLANLFKYAPFRFGPMYTAATGKSLLEGYRRQGRWALGIYALVTLATMFIVQAAVTVVTAGLALAVTGVRMSPITMSAVLLALCGALLLIGRYHWLDRLVRVLVVIFTVSTIAATVLVLPRIDWGQSWWLGAADLDRATIFFVVALVGWMPSAIDVAVWQSLWALARRHDTGHAPTLKESMLDFHIGYIGTVVLAFCFLLMGAGVMHGQGVEFEASAGGFAAQVIGLYRSTLGDWAKYIIGPAAFAVMFSTTLTVIDGFPRAVAILVARFRGPEGDDYELEQPAQRRTYWIAVVTLAAGSMLVLWLLLTSLKAMVDIATTLSFLTAPVLAGLNHRAMTSDDVPEEARPKSWLVGLSGLSIFVLGAFALYYLYFRYLSG